MNVTSVELYILRYFLAAILENINADDVGLRVVANKRLLQGK
jgi:hypothetical protein